MRSSKMSLKPPNKTKQINKQKKTKQRSKQKKAKTKTKNKSKTNIQRNTHLSPSIKLQS